VKTLDMRRRLEILGALLIVAGGPASAATIAAPGRIEGAAPTQELCFGESGRISEILVAAGAKVAAGQLLAKLDCSPIERERAALAAELAVAKRGARPEQVDQAGALRAAADARLRIARIELDRVAPLVAKQAATESKLDEARAAVDEALANQKAAESHLQELRHPLPPEERQVIEARMAALDLQLANCSITAPSDGVVGRRLVEPGTAVSILEPRPVLTFVNLASWHVRAEVAEEDIGSIALNERVTIRAPVFGDHEVTGVVSRIGGEMGRRSIRGDDPAEKNDRDVLEVLIRLDREPPVPIVGLRVRVIFDGSKG
jgi:multidrug resistance efflux pump